MFCELTPNYVSAQSKSCGQLYYFNTTNRESYYKDQIPPKKAAEIFASFRSNYLRRLLWKWTNLRQVEEHATDENPKILFRSDFMQFIAEKLGHC